MCVDQRKGCFLLRISLLFVLITYIYAASYNNMYHFPIQVQVLVEGITAANHSNHAYICVLIQLHCHYCKTTFYHVAMKFNNYFEKSVTIFLNFYCKIAITYVYQLCILCVPEVLCKSITSCRSYQPAL